MTALTPSAEHQGAAGAPLVRRYEPGDAPAWDALAARARVPHFMFRRDYVEYHRDRFRDHSLVVVEDGRLCAALPASRDGDVVTSHGGLTFGGLITDSRASAGRVLEWLDAIVAVLRDDGVATLVYKPVPHMYHEVPAEEDLFALMRMGARLSGRDLSAAICPQRPLRYSKGRKAAVKRAAGLHVARETDFAPFWAVEQEALLRRHGRAPVHSLEEIGRLAARFPDGIKLFTARSDGPGGELLGGVVVYETPVVAHAQYIASTEDGRAAGAVDAVVHHLLTDVYAAARWFDFGISSQSGGAELNVGLARNKESYGARAVVYDRYELALATARPAAP